MASSHCGLRIVACHTSPSRTVASHCHIVARHTSPSFFPVSRLRLSSSSRVFIVKAELAKSKAERDQFAARAEMIEANSAKARIKADAMKEQLTRMQSQQRHDVDQARDEAQVAREVEMAQVRAEQDAELAQLRGDKERVQMELERVQVRILSNE